MKKFIKTAFASAIALSFASNVMAAELTVYTAVEAEDLKRYANGVQRGSSGH